MTRRIPIVHDGILHEEAEQEASLNTVVVESDAWYGWLERHDAFRFESPAITFTARKEQRAGSWYWYAYRRHAGRLRTAYLGKSTELSLARLQIIADELAGTAGLPTPRTAAGKHVPRPLASPSQERTHATPPVPLHNLPRQLTSLVGREQEVAAAAALLQRPEVRLLTMVGTAGVGKTRLALQVATNLLEHFVDGVFFVALAPVRDPELVLSTVAQILGLRVTGDQSFLDVLKAHLRDKHCLLVLDNFEQVISAAPQLPELLRACPGMKLLVTSREVLHLRAEHQFSVPPLALPERKRLQDEQALTHVAAVELFLHRAQAIKPNFHLTTDNAAAIAEICIRLDGLPLAIELAAARVKVFTPQALLARLDHRLQVLTGGARDLPERQRTLRSTIAWSYELLPVEEQRLFRRLSVFVGGCTLGAVEAVSSAVGDSDVNVLEGMISLVDKSLLQQTGRDGEEPRFTMLETIREYGLEALTASGEAPATRQAHAAYYLTLAEQAEPAFTGPQQLTWFDRLEREHDNLRAALSWLLERGSDGQSNELTLRLAAALWNFWFIRGHVSEGRRWLERVLDANKHARSATRAKALVGAGNLATLQDDFDQIEVLGMQGLALYRELGDRRGCAVALSCLGYAAMMKCKYAQARALLEESLMITQELDDPADRIPALQVMASVHFYQGEYARAQVLLEEDLALVKERGDVHGHAVTLMLLGMVLLHQGDLAQAQAWLEEGSIVSRKVGYKRNLGLVIYFQGMVSLLQGDVTKARSLLEESLVLFQEVGERGRMAEVFASQGLISLSQGDFTAARTLLEEGLKIFLELNYKYDTGVSLVGLAAVMAAQGEVERAGWLLSAAEGLRETIGTPLPPALQSLHEFALATVRMHLSERAFATAWAEGRTMTPEQALAAQWPVAMPATAPAEPSSVFHLPHPPKSPAHSNGLTTRELEVLRLLAQGLTSAQIAERLIIGLVTVNSHVRSIYNKLGVTSRSAATRYAIEHKLV